MKTRGIGIIGHGTVGSGVLEILEERRASLTGSAGPYEIVGVAVRDPSRPREGIAQELLTTPEALLADPRLDVLVEVAGGVDDAWTWVRAALSAGKPVVTANKALLAERAEEIAALRASGDHIGGLYCEASVAGGIPILQLIDRGLLANRVVRLEGILNGTCNYLLTLMEREGVGMDEALKRAQALGFAEADPTLDVDGGDTAHKLAVLAGLALGRPVRHDQVFTQGIRAVTAFDVAWAQDHGYRIKLLAVAHLGDEAVELRVHPTLVRTTRLISQVSDEFNAVAVEGDLTGPQLYYGRGAGRLPTASAVVSDLVHALRGEPPLLGREGLHADVRIKPMGEIVGRHYLHLEVIDRPGVVEGVARALARADISIASLYQPETAPGTQVPLVFTTHAATDAQVHRALEELRGAPFLVAAPVHIRLED